jgi:hypothetical protein
MSSEDSQIVELLLRRTQDGRIPWRAYEMNQVDPWRQIFIARARFGEDDLMFEIVHQLMALPMTGIDRVVLNVRRIADKVETAVRPTDAGVEKLLNELFVAARRAATGDSPDPNKQRIIEALEQAQA